MRLAAFVLVPAGARAAGREVPSPAQTADNELRLGAADEVGGRFARALAHYRACIDGAPGSRAARSARMRIIWIGQRAEGDFVPLATLARVRADPAALADPAGLSRLAATAETFPAGLVRSELRLRIGEAWMRMGAHRAEALAELRAITADPSSGPADRRLAERDLLDARRAEPRLDGPPPKVDTRSLETAAGAAFALAAAVGLLARRGARQHVKDPNP